MKNRKLNVKKTIITIIVIVGVFALFFLVKGFLKPKDDRVGKQKIIGKINDYELKENASSYFKNVFNDLKVELSKDVVDEENYAKIISQLFIGDCYTLDNKINQNDVGGIQFVYEPFRDNFILIAKETMYSHIENNIYGNRKQELPVVSDVSITSITKDKYEYLDTKDDEAYFVNVNIQYTKDLGYSKEASLIIIHNNNKLEVAELE